MNRDKFTVVTAIALSALCMAAAAVAAEAVLPSHANAAAVAAVTDAASALRRPEPLPGRPVVAPPKPSVETIVLPGLDKIDKHERLTDVLKARKRAGRSDRVVAD